ncbi:ACP S-malonyltransferase [Gracilimonas mengyeensis]|uniref:Malonyl CoA-acyl carrier protein transacylase n=1 Tax=Gracilimonas mengyeensis TaxID=1302730 RepID=A0A521DSX6_9BACT|nr:ACP S-malonyltransferase [Gracilimonas mengyeensis]SMO74809.1 [Acyl-carrier-protein] S-malonyltransferase [Gracilimonas mengyeensis]
MSTAYLFPGQGSQFVGMGKELYGSNPDAAAYFDKANEILGIDLKGIMFEGPEETLKQTEFTQPAIFLHSIALFKTLDANPDMVAGHSLGEFSALVACGAISFEEALKIVRRRGELMQQAGTDNPGTMAAIIGMDDSEVEVVSTEATKATGKEVIAANYNCPGQLVISGYQEAVEKAVEIAKEKGARMAKLLPVSGAFHSSLMQPAYDGLKNQLEDLNIHTPNCPIYSNYTAKATTDTEKIRENLLKQLLNPVLWTQTLKNMHADGAQEFVEVGPGKVLQGLVKRTLKDVEISGHQ